MIAEYAIKNLTKFVYSVPGCNETYVYRCSKNLMDHVPAMKVLNQTFLCNSVYSGTYDNEFIILCQREIYPKVGNHSRSSVSVPAVVHQVTEDHTLWGLYYSLFMISILCLVMNAIVLKYISVETAKKWFSFPTAMMKIATFYIALVPLLLFQIIALVPIGWVPDTSDLGHISFQLPISWYAFARLYFKLVSMDDEIKLATTGDDRDITDINKSFCACLPFICCKRCKKSEIFDLEKFFILRHSPTKHMDTTFATVTGSIAWLQILNLLNFLSIYPMDSWPNDYFEWFYNHQVFHVLAASFVISTALAGYMFEHSMFLRRNVADLRIAFLCFYFGILLYFHSQEGRGIGKSQHDFFCILMFSSGIIKLFVGYTEAKEQSTGTDGESIDITSVESKKQPVDLYFTWTMVWAAFSLGLGGMGDRLLAWRLESENVFALAGICALFQVAFLSYLASAVVHICNSNGQKKTYQMVSVDVRDEDGTS